MEYNKVAAKWWANRLRNVSPDNFNMGEKRNDIGLYAMMLGTMLASKSRPDDESIDRFEHLLSDAIREHVEKYGSLTLSVDYGPDSILSSLAQETGISTNGFPWKTTMWISKEKVSVSAGYGAPCETIFPTAN